MGLDTPMEHSGSSAGGTAPARIFEQDPLAAAREYGMDITLLQSNLQLTPAQRLRQLDGLLDFVRRVRRG